MVGVAGSVAWCEGALSRFGLDEQGGHGWFDVLGDPAEVAGLPVHLACLRFVVGLYAVDPESAGFVEVLVEEPVGVGHQ